MSPGRNTAILPFNSYAFRTALRRHLTFKDIPDNFLNVKSLRPKKITHQKDFYYIFTIHIALKI